MGVSTLIELAASQQEIDCVRKRSLDHIMSLRAVRMDESNIRIWRPFAVSLLKDQSNSMRPASRKVGPPHVTKIKRVVGHQAVPRPASANWVKLGNVG